MKKVIYITMMACLAAGMLVACNDELVPQNSTHNSDIIGFSLECNEDSEQSRSNGVKQPFSGVLAMTADDSAADSLYLHTSYTNMIAMPEVKGKQKVESRGTPVTKDNFGTEFTVFAYTNVNNSARQYMNEVTVTKGTNDVWTPSQAFYWTENDLDFFAYRQDLNASHNIEYNSDGDTKEATFSYTVPKSQDGTVDATVQPDIMMAFNTCGKGDNNGVASLNFTHALAAVKFEIHVPITGKIKTVTIEGIKGSGSCVFDGTKAISTPDNASDDYVWTTSGSNASYTQTFNLDVNKEQMDATGEKVELTTEANSATTFMLIPQTLGADAKVTVVMEDSENNVTHTFTGKIGGEGLKWEAGKTYTYLISKDAVVWNYFLEVTPTVEFALVEDITKNFSVTSYKQTASADKTIPLKWAVTNFADIPQGVDENGVASDNGVGVNSTTKPEWLSEFTITGTGNVAENTVTIVPQKITSTYAGDITMQNNPTKGEEKDPWDLSTHRHDGTTRARCTANCYIVHSAGTYAIPLVYGNAIYNGQPNPSAYTYQSSGKETASQYIVGNNNVSGRTTRYNFQDHVIKSDVNAADGADDGITQPFISKNDGGKYDVKDAVMLWQDAYNIVKQGSVKYLPKSDPYNKMGVDALQFTLNQDFMQQGNIVFAVRDANGTILWSWHVWVYDHNFNAYYELENYEGKLGNAGTKAYTGTFKFATGNLGHCMGKNIKIPAHKTKVTFTQYDVDGTTPCPITKEMTATLQGLNFTETVGNNTYYQFGRKDPLVGVQNRTDNLKDYYTDTSIYPNVDTNPSLSYDTRKYGYKVIEERVTIAETIQNPTVFYSDGNNINGTGHTYLQRSYHNSRIDDWVYGPGTGRVPEVPALGNTSPTHMEEYVDENGETKTREVDTPGRESGYINLWNNFDYIHSNSCYFIPTTNQNCDEYNEKIDNNNTKVIKTVYDPCPVGFKMPPAAAFRCIGTFGRGTWHPMLISAEPKDANGNIITESIERITDESYGSLRYKYPIIWTKTGSTYVKNTSFDYATDNKFNGGFQLFTEGEGENKIDTYRYFINAKGASFTSGGDVTKMSIEATGQRYYGVDAGSTAGQNAIGVTNMAPTDVYLWTGDVVTNGKTLLNGNAGVSLFLQRDANFNGGFEADCQLIGAKAMARPIRPMWDEDFNEGLR